MSNMCVDVSVSKKILYAQRLESRTVNPFRDWALSNVFNVAIVDARDFLRRDLEHEAISRNFAVGECDADPRVFQFTSKDAAVAVVEAAVAVLQRAAFLTFGAARAGSRANGRWRSAAVACRRLCRVVGRAVAAVVGLADVERARNVARVAQVDGNDAVFVQLGARNRLRLGNPTLRIATCRTLGRLDRAEAERSALFDAAAFATGNANFVANRAGLENKRRLRLAVNERQSFAFAISIEIARQSKA